MSRIGKLPITVPADVKFTIEQTQVIIEGPKGKLTQNYNPLVKVELNEGFATVTRKNDSKRARAFHGLYRQLFSNMVTGVTKGFSKTLVVNGVGYRAEVKDKLLVLNLGYSTEFMVLIPESLEVKIEQGKIVISGISKEQVGEFAAQVRRLRSPEPYKGKGIRYDDEVIKRKVGKSGVK